MTSPVSSGWWGRGRFSRDSAPDPGGQTGKTQDNGGGDAGREKGKAGRGFPPPLRVWVRKGGAARAPHPQAAAPQIPFPHLPIPQPPATPNSNKNRYPKRPGRAASRGPKGTAKRRPHLGGVGGRRSRLFPRLAQPRCLPLQATAARAGKPKGLLPAGSRRGGGGGDGASPCLR